MATLSTVGLHFPEATPTGLFGVGHTQNAWFVVNKITGQAKRIGQVGGRINYFDRALEEADRRNKVKELFKRVTGVDVSVRCDNGEFYVTDPDGQEFRTGLVRKH